MSAPTRIYLVTVALILVVWVVGSTVIGAGAREYRSDARYIHENSHRLPAELRGRVVLRDRAGAPLDVPPSTLTVWVRARETDGPVAVRRIAEVDTNGLFEVVALPEGLAHVSVHLGSGAVVWQADGIACGRTGTTDTRLDPIDLGDLLFPVRLDVIDPEGLPAATGHLVWRTTDEASDDRSFEGDAPIRDGVATFLTTSQVIDVVTLVPGAETELFAGLWGDDRLDLAPGVTAAVRPTGDVPAAQDWTLRVALVPETLTPRIEYDETSLFEAGALISLVEGGVAELPLARGGRYSLEWWAAPVDGHRFDTLRMRGDKRVIDVPPGPGRHVIDVPFPMVEFARRASARR